MPCGKLCIRFPFEITCFPFLSGGTVPVPIRRNPQCGSDLRGLIASVCTSLPCKLHFAFLCSPYLIDLSGRQYTAHARISMKCRIPSARVPHQAIDLGSIPLDRTWLWFHKVTRLCGLSKRWHVLIPLPAISTPIGRQKTHTDIAVE